jgi:hypothetical protein
VFFCVLHNTQNCRIPCSHYSTAQKANKHNKLTQTPTKHRKPTAGCWFVLFVDLITNYNYNVRIIWQASFVV